MNNSPGDSSSEITATLAAAPCHLHQEAGTALPVAYEMLQQNLGKATACEVLRSFSIFLSDMTGELHIAIRDRDTAKARSITNEISRSCTVVGANRMLLSCTKILEAMRQSDWESVELCLLSALEAARDLKADLKLLMS